MTRKLQNKADILTFICMISLGILWYLLEHLPSGMEALYIMLPFAIVVLIHLSLGMSALFAAINTGQHLRNSWIYGYFCGVVLLTLFYTGILGALYTSGRASLERQEFALEDALLVAIEQNQQREVARLIQAGANPSYCFVWDRNHGQHAPLQLAVQHQAADIAGILLAAGADPDGACGSTRPSILTASTNRDLGSLRVLMKYGATLSVMDGSVLCLAIAGGNYSLPSSEQEAESHQKRHRHEAVQESVKLLLNGGADVNALQLGATPLHWAIAFDDLILVDMLLGAGADPNLGDRYFRIPITLAIRYNHPLITRRLLFDQPTVSISGLAGLQALQAAATRRDTQTIALLMQAGLDLTPLLTARVVAPGSGRQVDLADELYRALKDGDSLYFDALLAAGAEIDQPDKHQQGRVLVSLFAADPSKLQQLLAAGANVNARDRTGGTALHFYAACKNCADPVRAMKNLVQHGADINAPNGRGQTPLKVATERRLRDTTEFLVAEGAALELRDDQ